MPLASRGLRFLVDRDVFRCAKEVPGRMKFGRIFVRIAKQSSSNKERVRARGSWAVKMGVPGEFITAWWRMTGLRASGN